MYNLYASGMCSQRAMTWNRDLTLRLSDLPKSRDDASIANRSESYQRLSTKIYAGRPPAPPWAGNIEPTSKIATAHNNHKFLHSA